MGKKVPDAIIDQQLDLVAGDAIHACSAEPTTYAEASSTYQLATQALQAGDFVKSNGDVNGRKQTVTPPPNTPIDSDGVANHVAITNGSTLVDVTTSPPQALTSDGELSFGPFDHEIGDPA